MNSLICRGADINARDANGRTALMLAVLGQQDAAVDALLARGADANAADAGGISPLQAAVAAGQSKIAAALRRAGRPMKYSCMHAHIRRVAAGGQRRRDREAGNGRLEGPVCSPGLP